MPSPSEEERSRLLAKLGTDEARLTEDANSLHQWAAAQPHLPQLDSFYNDSFFKSFLVGCKNRMEISKQKLDAYFTMRSRLKNLCTKRDPIDPVFLKNLNLYPMVCLSMDGYRVWLNSVLSSNGSTFDMETGMKRYLNVMDVIMRDERGLSIGDYFVYDGSNVGADHLLRLDPVLVTEIYTVIKKVLPVKIKGIIYINASKPVEMCVNKLLKPLLGLKMADRLHFHSEGPEALEQYFPKECLPRDYGGEGDTSENLSRQLFEETVKHREWFMTKAELGVNESKRLEKCDFPIDSNFGVDGSFRKLSID